MLVSCCGVRRLRSMLGLLAAPRVLAPGFRQLFFVWRSDPHPSLAEFGLLMTDSSLFSSFSTCLFFVSAFSIFRGGWVRPRWSGEKMLAAGMCVPGPQFHALPGARLVLREVVLGTGGASASLLEDGIARECLVSAMVAATVWRCTRSVAVML